MDFKTGLLYAVGKRRIKQILQEEKNIAEIQAKQLEKILYEASFTRFGREIGILRGRSSEEFLRNFSPTDYEFFKPYIQSMIAGEVDVLVRGRCTHFAQSSGTTADKSKYIPVPKNYLKCSHYKGAQDLLWMYFYSNPDSRFFSTKGLVLGGSKSPTSINNHSWTGDLSAILIDCIPKLGEMVRVPSKKTLLMSEWNAKMDQIIREVRNLNVGSLSGVPSWMLVMIEKLLAQENKSNLLELWPNLEVFFHGGVSFKPYQAAFKRLIPFEKMNYRETFNASEGFFAFQDLPDDSGMRLIPDYGIYYEFIPMSQFPDGKPLALHQVEKNVNYALVITTLGGLYRYIIGDVVAFTSLEPPRLVITGRTKHYINAFGEELMVHNADKAIFFAAEATHAEVAEYTAAPRFFEDKAQGCHEWVIAFRREPDDLSVFVEQLDHNLKQLNSDYEAKRYCDMTLLPPKVYVAKVEVFHSWLESKKRLGGQNKIPRLSNDRTTLDELLTLLYSE